MGHLTHICRMGRFFSLLLIVLGCLAVGGCEEGIEDLVIVNSEKEANRILFELTNHRVAQAQKQEKTEQRRTVWRIVVPKGEAQAARAVLLDLNLPREEHGGLEAMVSQAGLIPTRSDERAKLMLAMASELERTFETYDRVVKARVHIVLPEKDALGVEEGARRASATVLIKYMPGPAGSGKAGVGIDPHKNPVDGPIPPELVAQMVARSVEGLGEAKVEGAKLEKESVVVAYTAVQPAHKCPEAAKAPGTAEADQRLLRLAVAAGLFGLLAIILTVLLVKEKRKNARLQLVGG